MLTTQPAIVYFPPGKYVVTATLQMAFYTFIHGNPLCVPEILWSGLGAAIGGPKSCNLCEHTNDFFYGVTDVNIVSAATSKTVDDCLVHWPVSQGTYLRGVALDVGSGHQGIFGEAGSGGLIADVSIKNGDYGMVFGNQQWTFRDVSITGCRITGIQILWNWVFTFVGLTITNTPIAITWPKGAASLILLDSKFEDVPQVISEGVPGNGFFLFERVSTANVKEMLDNHTAVPFYYSWRQGPALEVGKPLPNISGELPATSRASTPLVGRPRPHFGMKGVMPVSVMVFGAKGDGVTDDSAALQQAVDAHPEVFLPHGVYLIGKTITLTATTSLLGEGYSVIKASAANPLFAKNISDTAEPTPLLTMPVGASVKLVDLTIMASGDIPGCLLVDWKGGDESGMWDVMYRVEHTVWGQLRLTGTAAGYFENCWLWVADHIFDTGAEINVTSPRGILLQSSGKVVMMGVAAEHSSDYQYFLEGAQVCHSLPGPT